MELCPQASRLASLMTAPVGSMRTTAPPIEVNVVIRTNSGGTSMLAPIHARWGARTRRPLAHPPSHGYPHSEQRIGASDSGTPSS